jgi:hypothetical protein
MAASGKLQAAAECFRQIALDSSSSEGWRYVALTCAARAEDRSGNATKALADYDLAFKIPELLGYQKSEITNAGQALTRNASWPTDRETGRVPPPVLPSPKVQVWVSPTGSATAPGTQQRPLLTLEAARDRIRILRAAGKLSRGGAVVEIMTGTYRVNKTFELSSEDSGSATSPTLYTAAPGAAPVFDAGVQLRGFSGSPKVLTCDLGALGITDLGTLKLVGMASARGFKTNPLPQLYFNGQAMPLAGWRNIGRQAGWITAGVRLDDFISGVEIYGNVFDNCSDGGFGGVQINRGTDNVVENNIFYNCQRAISGGSMSASDWNTQLATDFLKFKLANVNAALPPYSARYPLLLHLGETPHTNIWNNVMLKCKAFTDGWDKDEIGNIILDTDPGFADAAHGDFRLKTNSPLKYRLNFQPVPFERIGVYADTHH